MNLINLNFESLCQLPSKVHVYLFDKDHHITNVNALQQKTAELQFGIKTLAELQQYTVDELYQLDRINRNQGLMVCQENEIILTTESSRVYYGTTCLLNVCLIDFKTVKLPYYDSDGKLAGVLGFSYYLREIDLTKANHYKLSSRELDCLDLLLLGNTAEETANQLHISSRTVETHLDNAKHKLNCQNKLELRNKLLNEKIIQRYNGV